MEIPVVLSGFNSFVDASKAEEEVSGTILSLCQPEAESNRIYDDV